MNELKFETFGEWYGQTTGLYWGYMIVTSMVLFPIVLFNYLFVSMATVDFRRRNYVSNLLTGMLEVDINRKKSVEARMLSINFMDPPSLLTWLELRRLVQQVGLRFYLRIQGNILIYMIFLGGQIGLIACSVLEYVNTDPLITFFHYMNILVQILLLFQYALPALLAASAQNSTT